MELLTESEKEERKRLRHLALEQVSRRSVAYRAAQVSKTQEIRTASGFTVMSLTRSMAEPATAVKWLWEDRLAAGTFNLLVAKPKVGKSTFARHLGSAVASGSNFLGVRVQAGKVIYLALEERLEDVRAGFLAIDQSWEGNLFIADTAVMQMVLELIEEVRPALLVIDPLIRLLRITNEHSYAKVYGVLGPFIDVARSTGTTILAMNHSPRQLRRDPIDMGIGSIGFSGAVSTQLVMRTLGDMRSLQSVQRIGPDLPETILILEKPSNTFVLGAGRGEFEQQEKDREMMAVIDASPGMTESEIDAAVVGRTEKKRGTLRRLKKEGKIKAEGTGKRNDPYRYQPALSGASK